ncbi:MAG: response regulator, partial [Oscillospiraceae bacterium]
IEKSGIPASCTTFESGEAFLQDYRAEKYDLIFMDIYMARITEIETVTAIREIDGAVPIAFVTTSTDHTLKSYRLEALKYIEKPVKKKAVQELLSLAQLKKENTPVQ